MQECIVTDAGLAHLVSSLQLCKSIQRCTMAAMFCSKTSPSQHMPGVSKILANCADTLEYANLAFNLIENDGLANLSEGLQLCKSLKCLLLRSTGLTPRCAPILRDIVSCLPILEALDVAQNHLGDSGLEQLAVGLVCCTRLTQLALSNTKISNHSIPILCRMLASLPSLVDLWADENGFQDDDLQQLRKAVHRDLQLHTSFPV